MKSLMKICVAMILISFAMNLGSAAVPKDVYIKVENRTGGEINVELGRYQKRLNDNDFLSVSFKQLGEVPNLSVSSTKERYAKWWTPITVDIKDQVQGRYKEGDIIIVTVTSSPIHGYMAQVQLKSEAAAQQQFTILSQYEKAWEVFPAVQKELLTPGYFKPALYIEAGLQELLDSKLPVREEERERLARLILELPRHYTLENVRTNFKQLNLKFHPNKIHPDEREIPRIKELSRQILEILRKAREILDPEFKA